MMGTFSGSEQRLTKEVVTYYFQRCLYSIPQHSAISFYSVLLHIGLYNHGQVEFNWMSEVYLGRTVYVSWSSTR